ncbi:hypothetical protein EWM64_g7679 [Hericium alpestre]|uniref:Neutral ceramidase n=1 Tax=Hericium alpestre TaxID=135208 RepID=A0A4Y9ZQM7_9AGAM|nr:hypothetical protein EWM64_g7679 [Hericium alpestre]
MPLLQLYAVGPLTENLNLHTLQNSMRAFVGLTNRVVFGLAAFFASASVFSAGSGSQAAFGVQPVAAQYLLGLGIGDITGPVVETNMMNYKLAHASAPFKKFRMTDIAMGDTGIRRSIVSQLSELYPGLYTNENIALVSTHQHSGVGGYLEDLLPQITSLGYVKETADAIVQGTVRAVQQAHASLAPGKLSLGNTTVVDGNANRSPSAYLANPADERAKYQYNQDKDLTLLRFDDASGKARGFLSFYPVHGTSLYENNTLISGDNKGMAAYLYESMVEPSAMPGNSTFVAGFTQSNVGDTSPNTLGAFCESPGEDYDGQACDFNSSTCGGTAQDCHGRGPGFRISDFESDRIIAQYQVDGANTLMGQTLAPVSGSVRWMHTYLNIDGPGAFDFVQGDNSSQPQNPFWEIVKGAVTPQPNAQQTACQSPKPILLNTGYAHTPYNWSPDTVDIQMLRVGNFVMLIMPGELTTMAGRRLRDAIRAQLIAGDVIGPDAYVVIAGPANTYAHYVATKEEYGVQRYEGASTIFGQYTLDAYIDKYGSLVSFLADNATGAMPASDPAPPDLSSEAITLRTPVVLDSPPSGKNFGDVLADVSTTTIYHAGDTVNVQFVGANPRNNFRLEGTFLTVDQLVSGSWTAVRSDSHPSTTYQWNRTNTLTGTSTVNVTWTIEDGTWDLSDIVLWRLEALFGSITSFTSQSSEFTVG